MNKRVKFSEAIIIGPQPSREELQQLKEEGFKSIINLREEGEEEQPLSPQEEGKIAGDLGLEYVHIPVSMDTMSEDKVDRFRERLASLAEPIYVHCRSGKRSGAFTMMHSAVEQGMSGEDALEEAEDMGFECDVPQLEEFVKKYVDKHAGRVSS